MKKEDKYYEDRSDLISNIGSFIRLCIDLDRDWSDELKDVLFEAKKNEYVEDSE